MISEKGDVFIAMFANDAIKKIMKKTGKTQKQISKDFDCSIQMVNIQLKEKNLPVKTVIKYAEMMDYQLVLVPADIEMPDSAIVIS